MSFIKNIPGFINQVEPPVLPVSFVKTEVIKNELPESDIVEICDDILGSSELVEEAIADIKDIEIVLHPLCEDSIKYETVPTNVLETKHSEYFVKTENAPFVKLGNITESETLIKIEDTSDGNGQEVAEVQGSNEHCNALGNLETEEQLVISFSGDLKGIGISSRKSKHSEKTDFARCYKTDETFLWKKEKEKIKVIKALIIPVEPHEYTSLAEDKHVCNHCQHSSKTLKLLKTHIKRIHREVTTMYQCPYCLYKSKSSLRDHIILKHKSAKDIQWFQCHLCEKKFKLKSLLTGHIKIHTHELCLVCGKRCTHKKGEKRYCFEKCAKQRQLNYHCDKCNYKTHHHQNLNNHKLTRLKPEEIEYFYCSHCSHKSKLKVNLKRHILSHFRNENIPFHCYICDFVTQKRDLIIEHIRKHFKNRNNYDKTISKYQLESRINKLKKRYPCDQCDYITYEKAYLKKHKLVHLKPEEIQYFYCHHCSYKTKRKYSLKVHISTHFRKGNVPFHCHICNFTTSKRDAIIEHKKPPKHHSK